MGVVGRARGFVEWNGEDLMGWKRETRDVSDFSSVNLLRFTGLGINK